MLPLVMGDRVVVVSEDEETGLAQVETSYCEKGLFPSACLKKVCILHIPRPSWLDPYVCALAGLSLCRETSRCRTTRSRGRCAGA
jgi:hypothetical protein